MASEYMINRLIYAWIGTSINIQKLIKCNKIEAYNLPLGQISHLIRDSGSNKVGVISKIGINTFIDPRNNGGMKTSKCIDNILGIISIDNIEYIHYKPISINVAIVKGTSSDEIGNISFEKEYLYVDSLNQCIAAKNNNGIVIVQVEYIVKNGTIKSRDVHIP